ncbi:MAG: 5-(carboxyamino)imidazole ribonucleotide mutase [Gammaproteobacteria bacterium]|nr:5-(carboxyamino)imidazole ribonucleotide mutase [Gammaproteobacteria bacterium]
MKKIPAPLIGVIMGSKSDLPVMQAAVELLSEFAVPHEVTIVSAHRTPKRMVEYAETAHGRGLKVIIAGAGGAAHLPGMTASLTTLPVIGVPVAVTVLNGMDALLSIAQMPAGVPVATVAINNASNAALLALRILALSDKRIARRLVAYKRGLEGKVLAAANDLENSPAR